MTEFVHLHVHSEYSLLDGLSSCKGLAKRAVDLDMPALALTDHGVMYGAVQFYKSCKAAGIKPIIGMEAYVAPRSRHDRDPKQDRSPYHLVLLAQNDTGYHNLMRLASIAQLEGFYYKPRIDRELLAEHAEGLIALSGCGSGEVVRHLKNGRIDAARETISWYREVFPDRYFLELQEHDIPELTEANKRLIPLARELELPLVATNDSHYTYAEDASAHDVLLCIQTGKTVTEPKRMRMDGESYYLKSGDEMAALFPDVPEAITNSLRIAEMCNVELEFGNYHLPIFEVPEGYDAQSYLRHLCEKGLRERYDEITPRIKERLDYELDIIHRMGFDTYFLIVWDLCRFSQKQDIWWNVRGSGASSIVAYSLYVTNLEPLHQNLIFERFLNEGRVTMPDIDLDYPDDQRADLIRYTIEKYGHKQVAQIITFGTMGAKAAIRDAGRALDYPLSEVDTIAGLVPSGPGVKLDYALEKVPDLQQQYKNQEHIRRLIDTARSVEGNIRHASTHAAGVIVTDTPLVNYAPLRRPTSGDDEDQIGVVTQYTMSELEELGLLKVDFLGLSTLTVMRRACELIQERHGVELDLLSIPRDDPSIYKLLSEGDTTGVFQVEGQGMRRTLTKMQPHQFEHVIAAISLYRPGPMEYIDDYIDRLHGEKEVEYRHSSLEPILEETFGIIVYQEQIIRILTDIAGYTPGEADLVRRAVGKKKKKALMKHRAIFIDGALENGLPRDAAEATFDDIEYFARYGFNKCLPGDVEIVDAATGELVRIEDLHKGVAQVEETTTCDVESLKLKTGRVTAVMDNGVKPIFRLTTALERQIEATPNHPFYTFEGWKRLDELQVGDRIAVPRQLPVEGAHTWPDYKVIVLGHLIAEGNLCHPHSVYYYTQDDEQADDYVNAVEQFDNVTCSVSVHKNTYSIYAKRIQRDVEPGVVRWVKELELWGKNARQKEIPAEAFTLNNRQIALLLSRLWAGDGNLSSQNGNRHAYYATASERLARQIQHLLLRLGVVSRIRRVTFPYKDGRIGYQVHVMGNEHTKQFAATVGQHFISDERREICSQMLNAEINITSGTRDTIPVPVKQIVRKEKEVAGITWPQMRQEAGVAQREFYPSHTASKKGFRRETIATLADYFDSHKLSRYAESDIYWDEVSDIEYVGEKKTYDLTIAGTHNFVANDILVHNSHAADYAVLTCQTAYLKANYPVEYMTALLTVERNNTEKIGFLIAECRRMGIEILPPHINHSGLNFTIKEQDDGSPAIRFGLGAVKNVGEGPIEAILEARQGEGAFEDLNDFCERVDLRQVNRRALESLIKVGTLHPFGKRSQLLPIADRIISLSANTHNAKDVGQMSLFGETTGVQMMAEETLLSAKTDAPEASQKEILAWEKDLVGVYVSEHPLTRVENRLSDVISGYVGALSEETPGQQVVVTGIVQRVHRHITKKGNEMAFVTLEDVQGSCDVVVFPSVWEDSKDLWLPESIVVVSGKVDSSKGEEPNLLCSWVKRPEDVTVASRPRRKQPPAHTPPSTPPRKKKPSANQQGKSTESRTIRVTLRESEKLEADKKKLQTIYNLLTKQEGIDRFIIRIINDHNPPTDLGFPRQTTCYSPELIKRLEQLVGSGAIEMIK